MRIVTRLLPCVAALAMALSPGFAAEGAAEDATPPRVVPVARMSTDALAVRVPLMQVNTALAANPPQWERAAEIMDRLLTEWATARMVTDAPGLAPTVRDHVEQLLTANPDLLREYRALVDPRVAAVLDAGVHRASDTALRSIALRAFRATRGREAAGVLAGRMADRGQRLAALRLLRRVLRDTPEGDAAAQAAIRLRIAACQAANGDADGAAETLRALPAVGPAQAAVARYAAAAAREPPVPSPAGCSPAPVLFAGPSGADRLVATRMYSFDLIPTEVDREPARPYAADAAMHWPGSGGYPLVAMSASGHRLLVKTPFSFTALDSVTAAPVWTAQDSTCPAMARSMLGNLLDHELEMHQTQSRYRFLSDGPTPGYLHGPGNFGAYLYFHDWPGVWFAETEREVYSIENWSRNPGGGGRVAQRGSRWDVWRQIARGREMPPVNRLAVHDRKTGARLWDLDAIPVSDDAFRMDCRTRFLSVAPTGGDRVFVLFEDARQLWVAALRRDTRDTIWRSVVCTAVAPEDTTWHPGALLVSDGDLYVLTGQGMITALDADTGAIEWVASYARAALGWNANTLYVAGARLIALPADAERALVLSREDGRLLRSIPAAGLRWPLGWNARRLWAASREAVGCLEIETGAAVWRRAMDRDRHIFGLGFVTEREAVTPAGRAILRLDAETGAVRGEALVAVPEEQSAGNLATDGARLYMAGLGYVARLDSGADVLARVETNAAAGARLQLGALREAWGEHAAAARAYAEALAATSDGDLRGRAAEAFVACLERPGAVAPGVALALLREAESRLGSERAARMLRLRARYAAAAGEWATAVDAYLALGRGSGPVTFPEPGGTLRAMPEGYAAAGLRGLLRAAPERVAPLLAERAAAARAAAAAASGGPAAIEELQRMCRLYPGTADGIEAGLAAARLAIERGEFERGELMAREMADSPLAATAAAGRAALEKLRLPDVPPADPPLYAASAFRPLADPPWRLLWSYEAEEPERIEIIEAAAAVHDDPWDRSTFRESHIFLLQTGPGRVTDLVCLRLADGTARYRTPLGDTPDLHRPYGEFPRHGHVLTLGAPGGSRSQTSKIVGFGLVSGRILWRADLKDAQKGSINYEPLIQDPPHSTPGVVTAAMDRNTVSCWDAATGRFLWEWRGSPWKMDAVTLDARHAVLFGSGGRELRVRDVRSGRSVTRAVVGEGLRFAVRANTARLTPHGLLVEDALTAARAEPFLQLLAMPDLSEIWMRDVSTKWASGGLSERMGEAVTLRSYGRCFELLRPADGRTVWRAAEEDGSALFPVHWNPATRRLYRMGVAGWDDRRQYTLVATDLGSAGGDTNLSFRSQWLPVKPARRNAAAVIHALGLVPLFARAGAYLPWAEPAEPEAYDNMGVPIHRQEAEPAIVRILDLRAGRFDEALERRSPELGERRDLREIRSHDGRLILVGTRSIRVFGPGK